MQRGAQVYATLLDHVPKVCFLLNPVSLLTKLHNASTHPHILPAILMLCPLCLSCCPVHVPQELRCLQLVEVIGLAPRDVALLPFLSNLHRLTLIAARDDSWLGLAPLRLFAKLPELRHLDWVISEKAVSSRSRCLDLQALVSYPKLQVLTLHTVMGRYEQLHAVSGQLRAGCHVRLMSPAFCEHASKKSGFGISRLLGVASCLLPGTVPVL